jgi:hypothetical protein
VCFYVYGTAHLLADISGYFESEPTAYDLARESFTSLRTRSFSDRPDDHDDPMVKFLYVVPSFATDRQRDTSGEIANYVFHWNEWIASQNGGFGVRVDTFDGALDITYLEIDTTPEEWDSWFDESLAPAAQELIAQGVPIGRDITSDDDLYYVVWEAFAGTYKKTGASGGQCRGVIDGQNAGYRMVGYAASNPGDEPCRMDYGRFPFGTSPAEQRYFHSGGMAPPSFVDHTMQLMRGLPDCEWIESPRDGELYTVPGTDIVEIRGGFIRDLLEDHDPLAFRMTWEDDATTNPELDVRHDTYFHITTGNLARTSCNSDAGRHPMWSDVPFYPESPTVPRRSVLDRQDDQEGRQLHAVYVKAQGVPDRALDTGLEIAAALRDLDAWLREETGGIGVRLDTYAGHVDVTYLPLPMTAEQYADSGSCIGERCPSDLDFYQVLVDAGYDDPDKTYAFFYDGGISPSGLCGGAGSSRSLLINLHDFSQGSCPSPWRSEQLDIFSLGHLVGHELMHTLGAVCSAAPAASDGYHSGVASDLMFGQADGPGQRLDANRDSYWGPGAPPGCDVSDDEIFTTDPNPEPLDGTSLDSVPTDVTDLQASDRTWWLNTAPEEAPSNESGSSPIGGNPSGEIGYPADTSVVTQCNEDSEEIAVIFNGQLTGSSRANQPMALIWITDNYGRCIASTTTSSSLGTWVLELPAAAYRNAEWAAGGGYCVVHDANDDGTFDSVGEPLRCGSSIERGTVTWALNS